MKKTRTLHGWVPEQDTTGYLMQLAKTEGYDSVVFGTQDQARSEGGAGIKRMTIRITIEDYTPQRRKKT